MTHTARFKWTAERHDAFIRGAAEGLTAPEIAGRLGTNAIAVYNYACRTGTRLPRTADKDRRARERKLAAQRARSRSLDDGAYEITLARGHRLLVDAADYPLVSSHVWCPVGRLNAQGGGVYVYTTIKTGDRFSKLAIHRFLLSAPDGIMVDHVNRNPLDNRRSNLRLCSPSENAANSAKPANASGFRGVYARYGGWTAQCCFEGRYITCGRFSSAEMAARAYDAIARLTQGDFAILNFPGEAA